jgi:hypothetical protein
MAQLETPKSEVVKKETASAPSLDVSSLEQYANAGTENITSNDVSLPFLKILTNNSPQVTQGDSKFIEKARPGQVINTVLGKLYNGKDGFKVSSLFL